LRNENLKKSLEIKPHKNILRGVPQKSGDYFFLEIFEVYLLLGRKSRGNVRQHGNAHRNTPRLCPSRTVRDCTVRTHLLTYWLDLSGSPLPPLSLLEGF